MVVVVGGVSLAAVSVFCRSVGVAQVAHRGLKQTEEKLMEEICLSVRLSP